MVIESTKWKALMAFTALAMGTGCSGGSSDSGADEDSTRPASVDALTTAELNPVILPSELALRLEGDDVPVILDVRSPEEYDAGHIPGAINIPYDRIGVSIESLESFRDREIVVYCRTGRRAGIAEEALGEAGFERVRDLDGHMVAWQAGNFPVAAPAVD